MLNKYFAELVLPSVMSVMLATLTLPGFAAGQGNLRNMLKSVNSHGIDASFNTAGAIDLDNAFFRSLGSNGRTCSTCHEPAQGWTITPQGVKERFEKTQGLHALFRLNDGANSPNAAVSTVEERRKAYSMLLSKANLRVGIGIPADAEFKLVEADDPYGHATASELSLFRRPLPSTNLKFLSSVMWDGRETTLMPGSSYCIFGTSTCYASVSFDLSTQANNATVGHAEALQTLTPEQRREIMTFESGLFTAQIHDTDAGNLITEGGRGGPMQLSKQDYYFGINDTLAGDYRTRASFNPKAMSLYDAWTRFNSAGSSEEDEQEKSSGSHSARAAIARGQALFNTKPIRITNVRGLNDDLNMGVIAGTCTTCHNAPNAGNHSVPMALDIGISDESRRTPDMPLYTLQNNVTGETIKTTDPGRALITGKWKDIGRFKGPVLRSVASRPPYFHDGSAVDLNAVVDYYNNRFEMGLTELEKADLVAFLAAL
jgi:cytochrome c peroxidase